MYKQFANCMGLNFVYNIHIVTIKLVCKKVEMSLSNNNSFF